MAAQRKLALANNIARKAAKAAKAAASATGGAPPPPSSVPVSSGAPPVTQPVPQVGTLINAIQNHKSKNVITPAARQLITDVAKEVVRDAAKAAALATGVAYVDPYTVQLTPIEQMNLALQEQRAKNVIITANRKAAKEVVRDAAKAAAKAAGVAYVDPYGKKLTAAQTTFNNMIYTINAANVPSNSDTGSGSDWSPT
jgi:hypothetical protein